MVEEGIKKTKGYAGKTQPLVNTWFIPPLCSGLEVGILAGRASGHLAAAGLLGEQAAQPVD